jgi:glycyl-tRNA synthetase beta chain
MAQLLLELFSEEIPARMQAKAERDLESLLADRLKAAGLTSEGRGTFSTPRRLTIVVEGLASRQPDVQEERKGPRVGAAEAAIAGFLRGAGLDSIDQAQVQTDAKGVDFYVAKINRKGRETPELIGEIVTDIVKSFPWPKSMRTGAGTMTWVRPLQRVVCLFDGEVVDLPLEGVICGRETEGHRFHAPGAFSVRRLEDYEAELKRRFVVLDREERKRMILAEAKTLCAARNLELVDDPGLLDEVCGLVEWPVVLMGEMDPAFLELPGEVIRLTMRTHQKYFAVRDPAKKALAPNFIIVANVAAKDGGKAIAAGNARVLSARLNDARFFWDMDRKKGLEDRERLAKLDQIVFHAKLGSVGDKARRIEALAADLAHIVGADVDLVRRAARLCKADLVTETVGEFPELQGQIGRQLLALGPPSALRATPPVSGGRKVSSPVNGGGGSRSDPEGDAAIAIAIEDHYRPLGPNDRVPTDKVAICLALADKLDSLVGFWAINEKPTGSSDAFGLRRAALGVVRICLSHVVRFGLRDVFKNAANRHAQAKTGIAGGWDEERGESLLTFLIDRLKVQLREQGLRHDLVDAVFALGDDDLVRIVMRVEALDAFLKTEDGKNLLAGYKRAANILAAEEKKKQGVAPDWVFDAALLQEAEEVALHAALAQATPIAKAAADKEDFAAAMKALSALRAPVDSFFDKVHVNTVEPMLRRNRLLLLARIRDSLSAVADFSKIEG